MPESIHQPGARRALALAESILIGAAALLVAYLGSRAQVYPTDSYFYLAKARSFLSGEWLTVPWNDGVDRRFFWGYSLALALPVKLFGVSAFWILAGVLHAWSGLVFTRVLRMLPLSEPARVGAVGLAMFNPVVLGWSTLPLSEPLVGAFAITSFYFALRFREGAAGRELLWASLMAGLALLTRPEGAFVGLLVILLAWPRLRDERRTVLAVVSGLLFLGPEAVHLGYLGLVAPPGLGVFAYLDELRAHFRDVRLFSGAWKHLRAPYWMVFRFDSEPWLYARYFPAWLTAAQGLVLVVYLFMIVSALASGFFRRTFAFFLALGLLASAALHSASCLTNERFAYLVCPAAALILAWGLDAPLTWASARVRTTVVLGFTLTFAGLAGAYGVRLSQMNAERLVLQNSGRDLRAIADAVNGFNPEARPVVTDFGPALAFYLKGHAYFDALEPGLFDDVMPDGEDARDFLIERRVALIVSRVPREDFRPPAGLVQGEYRLASVPGATLLVLQKPEPVAHRDENPRTP